MDKILGLRKRFAAWLLCTEETLDSICVWCLFIGALAITFSLAGR